MRRPLEAQSRMKELLHAYHRDLCDGTGPVAWCTSVGPAELLRAFGCRVFFPENHGALIGSRRLGGRYIPAAARAGYSADICSYLTADIGAFLAGETPLKDAGIDAVPRPDVLVFNTNQCREVKEWLSFYAKRFEAPLVGIHTPQNIDEITPDLLAYLEGCWGTLVSEIEGITGTAFDPDRFAEVTALSHRACTLWQRFLETARRRPSPHTFFDHIHLMAPVVVLRGTREAVAFYEGLLEEAASMDGSAFNERLRLFWEGMPVWGKTRFLAEFFDEHDVSVVASTYCHSWTFDFLGDDLFSSMASAYAEVFIARSQEVKFDWLKDAARRFDTDAVIFHDAKTCPHNTNTRYALPQRLQAEADLPVIPFHGDLIDLRHFSEEEFTLRMEAFFESLD